MRSQTNPSHSISTGGFSSDLSGSSLEECLVGDWRVASQEHGRRFTNDLSTRTRNQGLMWALTFRRNLYGSRDRQRP
jgi:hypothetical protein